MLAVLSGKLAARREVCAPHERAPNEIILDLDATDAR
jgi:hypothetical protein